MDATIRPASPGDLEPLVQLMTDQLREHGLPAEETQLRDGIRHVLEHSEKGFFLLASGRDARAVGAAYVPFLWSLEHGGAVAWLEELYVTPRSRGAGAGTALIRAACAEATVRGCRAVDLEVDSSHRRAAALYRREGFTPLARSRWERRLAR